MPLALTPAGGAVQEWIVDIVRQLGPFGIGLLMLLENVLPPIPSEIIMPLAGYLSDNGGTPFWTAVAAGVVGATLGALGWYTLALRIGRDRLMRFADGRGRWIGSSMRSSTISASSAGWWSAGRC